MALTPGTRFGPYEILSALGAGGMGEVYRARDTRLDRMVAIKVLSDSLASDARFRERFDREARALSQLTHPHICTLHDVGEEGGAAFLVMELVEGETLADRLKKGPLPLDHALKVAIQIADALSAAHRQGIVHRDLKPGNVMLTKTGAKLLDFGLAKASGPVAGAGLSMVPTTPPNLTAQGTILGTFQYMAPEQLEGGEADARSDIFAFGAVLYEMATGRKAFEGKSQASLIAAILEREPPPMSSLQPTTPFALDRVVRTCLAKDADARWQNAGDLARELKWIAEGGSPVAPATTSLAAKRSRQGAPVRWMAIVALAAIASAGAAALYLRAVQPEAPEIRFEINVPRPLLVPGDPGMAVSPDGRRLAYVGTAEGRSVLFVRALNEVSAHALPGTTGAVSPFWSPDGRSLAFFGAGRLMRVDLSGGEPQFLASAPNSRGGAWGADNTIVFAPRPSGGLSRVSGAGGGVSPLTTLTTGREASHRAPAFLPDGRHVLFAGQGLPEATGVYVVALDGSAPKLVLGGGASSPAFLPPDRLLFWRAGSLFSQSFDAKQLAVSGEPMRIVDDVAAYSMSPAGVLAYRQGGANNLPQLTWFDRAGAVLDTVGQPDVGPSSVELSPDRKRLATFRVVEAGVSNIWLMDVARGVPTRFTFDRDPDTYPLWSADGNRIVFTRTRSGKPTALFEKPSTSAEPEHLLLEASVPGVFAASDWSRDGRYLLYRAGGVDGTNNTNGKPDLWVLPMFGDRKPFVWVKTPFDEFNGQFSPDVHWIAYGSDEAGPGRLEIYVQSFPTPGAKWQASIAGGVEPRWRADGKELFYVSPDGAIMAVSIAVLPGGGSLEIGKPTRLFTPRIFGGFTNNVRIQYVVTPDGQRFLVNVTSARTDTSPIVVDVNWMALLKR